MTAWIEAQRLIGGIDEARERIRQRHVGRLVGFQGQLAREIADGGGVERGVVRAIGGSGRNRRRDGEPGCQ